MTEKADEIIDLLSGFFCLKRCKFKMIPKCTAHLIKILHFTSSFFFLGEGERNKQIHTARVPLQGALSVIILVLIVIATAGVSIKANYRRSTATCRTSYYRYYLFQHYCRIFLHSTDRT